MFAADEYFVYVKRLLVGLAVVAALGSAAPAEASTPMPWCGIGSSDVDRLPDATPGFAVHVAYVRPPRAADRLAEWAPRIVVNAELIGPAACCIVTLEMSSCPNGLAQANG